MHARRWSWLIALGTLGANNGAANPTWHLNVQAYSFHERTSETYLHNTTPGLGLIRRHDPSQRCSYPATMGR